MMGVSATGARGFGIWPVKGKSLVPLPAASTIALTRDRPFPASPRTAGSPPINYILSNAQRNFTTALPHGQVRRTFEALHGLENRGSRRGSSGAFKRRRSDRGRSEGARARHLRDRSWR